MSASHRQSWPVVRSEKWTDTGQYQYRRIENSPCACTHPVSIENEIVSSSKSWQRLRLHWSPTPLEMSAIDWDLNVHVPRHNQVLDLEKTDNICQKLLPDYQPDRLPVAQSCTERHHSSRSILSVHRRLIRITHLHSTRWVHSAVSSCCRMVAFVLF